MDFQKEVQEFLGESPLYMIAAYVLIKYLLRPLIQKAKEKNISVQAQKPKKN